MEEEKRNITPNWCYDIECFPNFFSVTFLNTNDDTTLSYIIFEDINHLNDIYEFVRDHVQWLIGYNNSKYDDILLRYVITAESLKSMTGDQITDVLFNMSKDIIGSQNQNISLYSISHLKPYVSDDPSLFGSVDLMSMMYFDKKRIGLKKVAVSMQWPTIQDLPKKFDEFVRRSEILEIMHYNLNDVKITKELMIQQKEELQIRVDVGNLYGLNLMSKSRSSMADMLMSKFWSDQTGQKYKDFKDLRTEYDFINLNECLSPKIGFKTPVLKKLHEEIKNTVWNKSSKFEHRISINNTSYDVLLGGLHSVRNPEIFESNSEYELVDLDVASYYPYLIISLGIFPKHLSEQFLILYKRLVDQRISAKNNGEKLTAEALKIVVNAIYGKLNFEYGWLFDTKASYTVTLTGQLYLLMLVEALELNGIEVFYANTDGLTCKVKKSLRNKFDEICKGWQEYTSLDLEFNNYSKCIIRDVNNYLILTESGKIKSKGCFTKEVDMSKGYNNPVVPHALQMYFLSNVSIETAIKTHKNIYDFCKCQNVGSQYIQEYHDLNATKDSLEITTCQKTNRYYVSNTTGKLYKKKADGSLSDLVAGFCVTLFNDYKELDMKDYKINYAYYIAEANKIVRTMEPNQLELPF